MHRDQLMKILVYSSGFLCALIFIGSKSSFVMEECFPPNRRNGDLYEIARVSEFFEARPPIDRTRSPARVDDPNAADIIVFGDSFMRAASGHPTFIDQLAERTGRSIWMGGRYAPSALFDLDDRRPRTVLIESIDRFIDLDFASDLTPAPASPGPPRWFTTALDWRVRLFRNTELNSRHLIGNLPVGRQVVNALADARYSLWGEISEKTPRQLHDPPTLFYYQNVESGAGSFFKGHAYQHTDAEIAQVADALSALATELEKKNARLLFMGIPNKYLLYGGIEERYDRFLPRLDAALTARGVATIDLLEAYRREPGMVFWPSDTHWNARGVEIAVEKVSSAIEAMGVTPAVSVATEQEGGSGRVVPARFAETDRSVEKSLTPTHAPEDE